MKEKLIARLLFKYFESPSLVTHVTGWKLAETFSDEPLREAKFLDWCVPKDENPFHLFDDYEIDSVEYMYAALNDLPNRSLIAKWTFISSDDGGPDGLFELDYNEYVFWARKSRWLSSEAACLSVGFPPSESTLENFSRIDERHAKTCSIFSEFLDRQKLYFDAIESGGLKATFAFNTEAHVLEFVDWFERLDFKVPKGLISTVRRFHGGPEWQFAPKPDVSEKNFDPRERNSLLQIILVMAMDCYKFDPKSKRVDMAKEIEERAASNGMKISRETIRNHLKSAGELLQGEWNHD